MAMLVVHPTSLPPRIQVLSLYSRFATYSLSTYSTLARPKPARSILGWLRTCVATVTSTCSAMARAALYPTAGKEGQSGLQSSARIKARMRRVMAVLGSVDQLKWNRSTALHESGQRPRPAHFSWAGRLLGGRRRPFPV